MSLIPESLLTKRDQIENLITGGFFTKLYFGFLHTLFWTLLSGNLAILEWMVFWLGGKHFPICGRSNPVFCPTVRDNVPEMATSFPFIAIQCFEIHHFRSIISNRVFCPTIRCTRWSPYFYLLQSSVLKSNISNPKLILCIDFAASSFTRPWHWNVCNWFQIPHPYFVGAPLFLQSYNIERPILCTQIFQIWKISNILCNNISKQFQKPAIVLSQAWLAVTIVLALQGTKCFWWSDQKKRDNVSNLINFGKEPWASNLIPVWWRWFPHICPQIQCNQMLI